MIKSDYSIPSMMDMRVKINMKFQNELEYLGLLLSGH